MAEYSRKRPGGPGSIPSAMRDPPRFSPSTHVSHAFDDQYQTSFDDLSGWASTNGASTFPNPAEDFEPVYPDTYTTSSRPVTSNTSISQEVALRNGTQAAFSPFSQGEGQIVRSYPTDSLPPSVSTRDQDLAQRAEIAKREGLAKRKQIPPFVQKLSSFLNRRENTDLIRWSKDGTSFIVLDEDEFARKLIPELFKHNNYASFVRQLNMYGFHKKVGLSDNSMRSSERKTKNPSEYSNPYFRRDHPELLWLIQKPKGMRAPQRKHKSEPGSEDEVDEEYYGENGIHVAANNGSNKGYIRGQMSSDMINQVLAELKDVSYSQRLIANRLSKIEADNAMIKEQAFAVTSQHMKHENSINSIIAFLANFFQLRVQGNAQLGSLYSNMVHSDRDPTPGANESLSQRRGANQRLLEYRQGGGSDDTVSSNGRITTASPAISVQDDFNDRQHDPGVRPQSQADRMVPVKTESPSTRPASTQWNEFSKSAERPGPTPSSLGLPSNSQLQQWNLSSLNPQQQSELMTLFTNVTSPHSSQNDPANSVGINNPSSLSLASPQINHRQLQQSEKEMKDLHRMMQENQARVESLQGMLRPLTPNAQGVPSVDINGDVSAQEMNDIFGTDGYFADMPDGFAGFEDDKEDPLFGASSVGFDGAIDDTPVPDGALHDNDMKPSSHLLGNAQDRADKVSSLETSKEASRATSVENENDEEAAAGGSYDGRTRSSTKRRKIGG